MTGLIGVCNQRDNDLKRSIMPVNTVTDGTTKYAMNCTFYFVFVKQVIVTRGKYRVIRVNLAIMYIISDRKFL